MKQALGEADCAICFQVGNLGLLFMLLFFIYAALGVELFGKLGKSQEDHVPVLAIGLLGS